MLYSETFLPFYTYGWAQLRAGRLGRWKFIQAPTVELYDLMRDPRELSNISATNPGLLHDLQRDLNDMVEAMGDREETLDLDTESIAKLQALGYLGGTVQVGEPDGDRPDPKDSIATHVDLERARRFMQDRLYEQAGRSLDRVLALDPHNLAALTEKANALEGQGLSDEAISVVDRALRLAPESPPLLIQAAQLEGSRGQSDTARKLVDRALSIGPLEDSPAADDVVEMLPGVPVARRMAPGLQRENPESHER